jgi:hypothetical protein
MNLISRKSEYVIKRILHKIKKCLFISRFNNIYNILKISIDLVKRIFNYYFVLKYIFVH